MQRGPSTNPDAADSEFLPRLSIRGGGRPSVGRTTTTEQGTLWHRMTRRTATGFTFDLDDKSTADTAQQALRARLERDWQAGGFQLVWGGNREILESEDANRIIADFVREKIGQVVRDPETATKLRPHG
jgi:hypothetical protein